MPRSWNVAQITVVSLLVWGAYWAALPWIDCIRAFPAAVPIGDRLRFCTFGVGLPGFPPPLGWNLVGSAVYLVAAIWMALRRQ